MLVAWMSFWEGGCSDIGESPPARGWRSKLVGFQDIGFPLGEAHPPSVDCEAIGRFGRKKRLVDAETQEHNL